MFQAGPRDGEELVSSNVAEAHRGWRVRERAGVHTPLTLLKILDFMPSLSSQEGHDTIGEVTLYFCIILNFRQTGKLSTRNPTYTLVTLTSDCHCPCPRWLRGAVNIESLSLGETQA